MPGSEAKPEFQGGVKTGVDQHNEGNNGRKGRKGEAA